MLKAAVFDEFKGSRTLLLWGDDAGMKALLAGLSALRRAERVELLLDEEDTRLTICSVASPGKLSRLRREGEGLLWECSADTLQIAEDLVRPLVNEAGHQFLDASGIAEQVIISKDEYPADLI